MSFIGIAADPRFEQSRRVYVAEAEPLADGARELRIVRYRDVQDTLGEPAVIVAGVPRIRDWCGALHGGFRRANLHRDFRNADEHDNLHDPLCWGLSQMEVLCVSTARHRPSSAGAWSAPTTIVWDDQAQQLWLSGVDGAAAAVVRIPVNSLTSSDEWPRVPRVVRVVFTQPGIGRVSERGHTENTAMLLVPTPLGARVSRVSESADGAAGGIRSRTRTTGRYRVGSTDEVRVRGNRRHVRRRQLYLEVSIDGYVFGRLLGNDIRTH